MLTNKKWQISNYLHRILTYFKCVLNCSEANIYANSLVPEPYPYILE